MPSVTEPRGSMPSAKARGACRAIGIAAVLAVHATSASARTSLAEAHDRWFRTDRSIACVDPEGNDRRCVPSKDTTMGVHVDPATSTALVFVTYLPDPTGNAVATSAAVFREGPGGWVFVRNLARVPERAPDKVAFRKGVAIFTAEAFRPGDSRCCPTGRNAYRIRLP